MLEALAATQLGFKQVFDHEVRSWSKQKQSESLKPLKGLFKESAICLEKARLRKACVCLVMAAFLNLNVPSIDGANSLELQSHSLSSVLLTQNTRENNSNPGTAKTMAPEEMKSLIDQARDSWTTGNAEAFAALFTPDGVFIVPGQRWVGRDAIRKVAAEFAASHSDVEISIQNTVLGDNRAVVEWTWKDVEKETGSRTKAEDAIVIDFRVGQISRWREYIDVESPKAEQ